MSRIKGIVATLRSAARRDAAEIRMQEEFRFHLEMETEKNLRLGLPPDEARRRALLDFGGVERHREEMRDGRGARVLEDLWADVRYAVRTLRRSPGFAIAAALTVALGVGLNGIVFGVVNAFVLRPIPAAHPEQLVALFNVNTRSGQADELGYEDFLDFRDKSGIFAGLAVQNGIPLNLRAGQTADMVWGELVSENYFDVLGIRPVLGRFFPPGDVAPGSDPVAILSYDSWRHRFNADPAVVGREVQINGSRFTIIGVAPEGFRGTRMFGFWPEMWVPLGMYQTVISRSTNMLRGRGGGWAITFGRMRPGWTRERTQAAASLFARQLERSYPATNRNVGALLIPVRSGFDNPTFVRPRLLILVSSLAIFAVTLVLLIVCANLANLLLARMASRQHELAIRLSLGCSRGRLVRQLLVECGVLALPGIALGLGLAFAAPLLERGMVPHLQFHVGINSSADVRVIAYTVAVAVVAVLLFGLAPALRASRPALVASLKSVIGERAGTGGGLGMRATLVVAQLALSVVLLVGGTLFVRSLLAARAVDIGFDPHDRVVLSVNTGLQGYDAARGQAFYRDVARRVAAIPGVESASWGFPVPFDTYGRGVVLYIDGIAHTPDEPTVSAQNSVVDVGFFDALGIPLVSGRGFAEGDSAGAPLRMVVSRAMAARFWPGRDPIGQRARLGGADGPEVTVVGVAGDAKFTSLGESPESRAYLALRQRYRDWETLVVHTRGAPERIMREVRDVVAAADPALPTFGAATMEQGLDNALNAAQTAAGFAGVFGLVALFIASIGLYALVANIVTERTREIGVRIALGATRSSVLRLVIGRAGRLAAVGLVIGIAGAAMVARLLRGLLYGMSPHDPLTFVSVPVVLGAIVLAASYIPARRATKLDPMAALRE